MSKVHQFVEDTLNSIESIKTAEAPYFFNTRVQAKYLQAYANKSAIWILNFKPMYIITSLFILLSFNIYTFIQLKKTDNNFYQSANKTSIESFATNYQLNTSSSY